MNRILVLIIFCALMTGCSEHKQSTAKQEIVAMPVAFNASGAPTVEFSVTDMMCPEGCGEKVKEVLSHQPGAKEVLVDFEAKKVKVAVDDSGKFDANAAVAALVDHGFANSSVAGAQQSSDPKPESPVEDKAKEHGAG
jgi:copper chaperone CopZ